MNGATNKPAKSESPWISSSADRMVGADHAEVRYFTRYVYNLNTLVFFLSILTPVHKAMIIMVMSPRSSCEERSANRWVPKPVQAFMKKCL